MIIVRGQKGEPMVDMMTFPDTWEEYEEQYGFNDEYEVYTNWARLIPSFRVKQWLEHLSTVAKKETVEWIPVSERLPEFHDEVLVTALGEVAIAWLYVDGRWRSNDLVESMYKYITAWMPLPKPYKGDEE